MALGLSHLAQVPLDAVLVLSQALPLKGKLGSWDLLPTAQGSFCCLLNTQAKSLLTTPARGVILAALQGQAQKSLTLEILILVSEGFVSSLFEVCFVLLASYQEG